jgi:ribulose 1,5-bisphosphate synthetase/thiazole synthase
MVKTIKEPSREIPVIDEPDVVVLGGGPAGYVAAAAAGRSGADALLIERYGHLGGMATGGHVIVLNSIADAERQIVFGIPLEVVERSIRLGGVAYPGARRNPLIDAEIHKFVADQIVEESGAKMRLHSWAVSVVMERNAIKGIIIESKSGREAILAKIVIDATGDADVAAFAGAEFTIGKLPVTLMNRVGGVDIERAMKWQQENPEMYNRFLEQLYKIGAFLSPDITRKWRIGTGWAPTTRESVIYCHWASFQNVDCTKAEELTRCEVEGRKRLVTAIDLYRRNVHGFEKAFPVDTCPQMGTRRSRIIAGEYVLTEEDIKEHRSFADNVATCAIGGSESGIYEIPYRCLVPKKIDNLLVAGRCISTEAEAQVFTRDIGPCMAMGQAAGAAAAIAAKGGSRPRELIKKASILREELIKQGVNLGQK